MPKKEKGRSHSTRPLSRRSPSWCRYAPEEVEALIVKLAREGHPPSRIGVILRDQNGIPLVKPIIGKGIIEVLRENKLAPAIPDDLEALLRKAARLRAHLDKNRSDRYNRRSVQIIESKIYSLSDYYRRKGVLPRDWRYTPTALFIT